MTPLSQVRILWLALALSVAGCAGSPVRKQPDPRVSTVGSISVVFSTTSSNYAYVGTDGTAVPGGAPPIRSLGQGVVAGVTWAALTALESAAVEHARLGAVPIGASVADIDVPWTFVSAMAAARTPTGQTVHTSLSSRTLDYAQANTTFGEEHSSIARSSPTDATLFVRLDPFIRGTEHSASIDVRFALFARDGQVLYVDEVRLLGVAPAGRTTEELVRWWADRRFRRLLLHGIRASVDVLVTTLWQSRAPSSALAPEVAGAHASQHDQHPIFSRELFSDPCALDSDTRTTHFRYVRSRSFVRAALRCDDSADTADLNLAPISEVWRSTVFPKQLAPRLRSDG